MFRCFFTSNSKQRVLYNSNPSFTTFAASPLLPPPPLLENNKSTFLLKLQNNNPLIKPAPTRIPLQELVNHYKLSQSYLENTPILPHDPHWNSFDVYEDLIHAYKDSCCRKKSRQFHSKIFKYGFDSDLFLCNTLINGYVRSGDLVSAGKLFNEMPEKNGVTWACLISGYTHNGMPEEACEIFKGMISEGCLPNRFAFGGALQACKELKLGMQIHGMILKSPYAGGIFCDCIVKG